MSGETPDDEGRQNDAQRLDKWLWHARFARTRTAAARLVTDGHVRINAKREMTCAKQVRRGDVLTLSLGRGVLVVRLRDLADRRGSALQAQLLYEPVGDDLPSAGNGAWIGRLAPENQRG